MEKENLDLTDIVSNIGARVTINHVRLNNLIQLLINKGCLTEDELEQIFEETFDKESKRVNDFILTGKV